KLELAELQSLSPPPLPEWLSAVPSHLGRRFHSFPALLRLLLRTGCRRAGRLTGNIPFRRGGSCRFLARWSFPALPCTGLSRSSALGRRATFLHRSGLLRGRGLRLRRFPLRLLCFSRARFFRGALAL